MGKVLECGNDLFCTNCKFAKMLFFLQLLLFFQTANVNVFTGFNSGAVHQFFCPFSVRFEHLDWWSCLVPVKLSFHLAC